MSDTERPYRVKIEASKRGGYIITVVGPGIALADVGHAETEDEAREWAQEHVAWVKHRAPAVEYEL